jgi:DNA-binding CsgD family transcriptional regulator
MRALAAVHRSRARATMGDIDGARSDLADARALIETTGFMQGIPWLLASEGLLELTLGDAEAAERVMAPLVALVEASGVREPMQVYYVPDALEALTCLGELARAEALLEPFDRRARELDRGWAIANAARCRSLLAAARGDLDAALRDAEDAVRRWQSLELPIELGRALLALGQVHRRRGERRRARDVLERALGLFRDRSARPWAERATEELRRIPIRRGAPADLTPTEERVAALAGAGRTNREVAQALFMSPKTVEANLARVYGKLGIRSRAELGARMTERQAKK